MVASANNEPTDDSNRSTIMIAIVAFGVITASLINKRSVTKRLRDEQEAAAS